MSNCTSHTNLIVIRFSIGIVGLLTYVCNGLSAICDQIANPTLSQLLWFSSLSFDWIVYYYQAK